MGKILREVIEGLEDMEIKGNQDIDVRGITCDSHKVEEGFLFVCIPGFNFDGHDFISEAIKKALSLARNGDLVLIAGKGHEEYQIVKDKRMPFSDRKIVQKILGREK